MRQRHKVILRQVVRPPYVYRWGVLLGTVSTVVALSTTAIAAQVAAWDTGATRAAIPAVGVPPALSPEVSSRLLTLTARPGRTVALTFDDGPHPDYTPRVLALLRRHGMTATFCMVGEEAARHPQLVRDVVAAGMTLCDHTLDHDATLGSQPPHRLERGLEVSERALVAAAGPGIPLRYFRAPEGRWTVALQRAVARHGMWPLGWSVDSLDWTRPGTEQIVADVKRQVRPGSVILFHDGGGPREQTVAALARLLPWLEDQGYEVDAPATPRETPPETPTAPTVDTVEAASRR